MSTGLLGDDEKSAELDKADGCTTLSVLNAIEQCNLKWLILCHMNFISN